MGSIYWQDWMMHWTAWSTPVCRCHSEGMIPHRGANNLGQNWTSSMGGYQGWVESKEGQTPPPYTAT
eukprot:1457182-Prorocentrum_lima.AAC.1